MIGFTLALLSILCTAINCALSNGHRSKRVINDQYATPHSRPWMVMLNRDGKRICGAALVNRPSNHQADLDQGSSDILLTAAHCLVQYTENTNFEFLADHKRFSALFGKHNSTGYEDTQVEVKVVNIIVHPKYDVVENDIAMVKLERPVNFSATIKPIALSNFSLDEMTNCSIAGWGRYVGIPDYQDPNTVLSVLDLPDLVEMDDKYEMELDNWNKTTVPGDSGSPMTCWKDGGIFLQGIVSYSECREDVSDCRETVNFGPYNINITAVRNVIFQSVAFFLESDWIMDAFQNVDTPSIWFNALSEYATKAAYSANEECLLLTTTQLVNKYYSGLPEGYNRELILPQWNQADYVKLWFENKIYDEIREVLYTQLDIQYIIGYTKQSDPHKCAIDCFMWNGNQPCILMLDINRCFFLSGMHLVEKKQKNTNMLGIRMKGNTTALDSKEQFYFKTVKEVSVTPPPKNWIVSISIEEREDYHCLGMLTSTDRKTFDRVSVSRNCFFGLRQIHEGNHQAIVTAIINGTIYSSTLDILRKESLHDLCETQIMLQSPIPLASLDSDEFGHTIVSNEIPSLRRFNPFNGAYRLDQRDRPLIVHIFTDWRIGKKCYGVLINESTFSTIEKHTDHTHYVLTSASCIEMHKGGPAFVAIGYHSIDGRNDSWQEQQIFSVHVYPKDDQASKGLALIELAYPIKFDSQIKPVAFKDPESLQPYSALLYLSYDSACNHDPKELLHEIPVKINNYSDDVNAADIFTEREFYVQSNHSCHGQIGYHGEPLFSYDSISDEYHLLGLSSGVIRRDIKFIDSYKSVWHYLPWIGETIRKISAQNEEADRIWEEDWKKWHEENSDDLK